MATENAPRDENHVPTILFVGSDGFTHPAEGDETTGRLKVDNSGGGSGTVTSVSVVSANGFAGTVATATTTPAITLTTTITGILKGNGTAISAITVGSGLSYDGTTLSATSSVPTTITVANEATDTTCFLAFFTAATGDLGPKTNANLTFDSSTGVLTLVAPILGTPTSGTLTNCTGLPIVAGTTGTLSLARGGTGLTTITALSIWVANSANTLAELTPGAGNSIRINGAGNAWEAFTPSASVPTTITVADEATDTTCFVAFFTAATGDLGPKTNSHLTYDSLNNILHVHKIAGDATDGLLVESANGTDIAIMGAANTANVSWYGNHNFGGTLIQPTANDGAALGAAATSWSDLYLASGAIIGFANGNAVITHSSGILTVSTGDLRITTAGTDSASVATVGGTQTLTNKTLTAPKIANAGFVADANGNELIIFTTTASAVNEITYANAATANNPSITASGGDANVGLDINLKGTGTFNIKGNATQAAELRLYEDTDDGSNYASFKVPALAANTTYTLPSNDGDASQFLQTDGSGTLSWASAGSSSFVGCRVYLNSQQTGIATGTWTKVNFDTESYDTGADWDTTNKRFVIPTTGYYAVAAWVKWTNVITEETRLAIKYNDTTYLSYIQETGKGAGTYIMSKIYDVISLTANGSNYIEFFVQQSSGGDESINQGSNISWATVTYLGS